MRRAIPLFVLSLGTLLGSAPAFGQLSAVNWNVAGPADWSDGDNWSSLAPPEADFLESANIGNGGVAQIMGAVADVSALNVSNGGLEIGNAGSLGVVLDDFEPASGQASIGATGRIEITGAGQLNLEGNLSNAGRLTFWGTNSHVGVGGNYNQQSTGSLYMALPTAVGGSLQVDGKATLGGTLIPEFGTNPLEFNDSWDVLTANEIVGNFASIQLPPGYRLDRGLVLTTFIPGNTLSLLVDNQPILVVDRVTGAATITNVIGDAIHLNGYSIGSAKGLLNAASLNGLSDQAIAGWQEANPLNSLISELNLTGSSMLAVDGSLSLGNIYNGGATNPREEDVVFEYSTPDGQVLSGLVEYVGPVNDLVLRVDPTTGEAAIQNMSQFVDPFDVIGYSILSPSGSLTPPSWMSFADTGDAGAGWEEANPQEDALAELNLTGSSIFDNGTQIRIGNIFNTDGERDLVFEFATLGGDRLLGTVEFGAIEDAMDFLEADFNKDGTVSLTDFNILKGNFGSTGDMSQGDANMDGNINLADFNILKSQFGQSSGNAVPEPATLCLAFLGLLGCAIKHAGRRAVRYLVAAFACVSMGAPALAVDFDTRFIKIDKSGPNNEINDAIEAWGILNGTVDAIFEEDITDKVDIIDLGSGGNFAINNPYANGVGDSSMDDFLQYVYGWIEIPEGTWTIGFGSDDGGILRIPAARFTTTYAENGILVDGDGELMANTPRGHSWTTGTFTAPAGGLQSRFEVMFHERGGGDSLEVALFNGESSTLDGAVIGSTWTLLEDGALGWDVIDFNFTPGDFNADGSVDLDDYDLLRNNFGTGTEFRKGDNNLDGKVNLHDFVEFVDLYAAAQGGAAVPEPSAWILAVMGVVTVWGATRRAAQRPRVFSERPVMNIARALVVGVAIFGLAGQATAGLFKIDFAILAGEAEGWNSFGTLEEDEVYEITDFDGSGDNDVMFTVLDDPFAANNPAPPASEKVYDGITVPLEALGDYLYKNPDTAGTSARFRFDNLNPGAYRVTVFEGRTSDGNGQFAKIWVGNGQGSGEPNSPNTTNFAASSSTVSINLGAGESLWYRHLEDNTGGISGMIIRSLPLLSGDFNSDGAVDLDDFQLLRNNFNDDGGYADGDIDFTGHIDLADFIKFRDAYNAGQGGAVPEPATWILGSIALAMLPVLGMRTRC